MLDIVVEFLSVIKNDSLSFYMQPVTYEGVAVPGSPIEVIVAPSPAQVVPQVACISTDIGRASRAWILDSIRNNKNVSHIDFLANFKWQPDACSLPTLACLLSASAKSNQTCLPAGHKAMVYAIGDSVMRIQTYSLATILGEDTTIGYSMRTDQESHKPPNSLAFTCNAMRHMMAYCHA